MLSPPNPAIRFPKAASSGSGAWTRGPTHGKNGRGNAKKALLNVSNCSRVNRVNWGGLGGSLPPALGKELPRQLGASWSSPRGRHDWVKQVSSDGSRPSSFPEVYEVPRRLFWPVRLQGIAHCGCCARPLSPSRFWSAFRHSDPRNLPRSSRRPAGQKET